MWWIFSIGSLRLLVTKAILHFKSFVAHARPVKASIITTMQRQTVVFVCFSILFNSTVGWLEVVPVKQRLVEENDGARTNSLLESNPTGGDDEEFSEIAPLQQQWIVDYLLKYGYLDFGFIEQTPTIASPPTIAAFRSGRPQPLLDAPTTTSRSDEISSALARFQVFSGLKPSGKIDFETRQQLIQPRCGVRDLDREFKSFKVTSTTAAPTKERLQRRYAVSQSIKWSTKRLTFKFLNHSASLGVDKTRKLVTRALEKWAKAAKLTIVEQKATATANLSFLFARRQHGDAYRFDGSGAVLAHAFFPGEQRGGEVHFDDDEAWFDRDIVDTLKVSGVDLYAVALHEIGHALGLGHSAATDSVMNPWYNNYAADPRLGDDDLHALAFLYGSGSVEESVTKNPEKELSPSDRIIPDVCDTDFDAISIIKSKIYAFRGAKLWRFEKDGALSDSFPMAASDFFMGLPSHLKQIDTFYERKVDKDVMVFSGDRYWRFRTNSLIPGFPPNGRPVLELGLPSDVKRIDAIFIWSGNRRTYVVAGDRYWRLDELRNHVDFTYPRPVERFWRNVPLPIISAFLNTDGITYFVVESQGASSSLRRFIPFDDYRLEAAQSRPLETTKLWTGCLEIGETRLDAFSSSSSSLPIVISRRHYAVLFATVAGTYYFILPLIL